MSIQKNASTTSSSTTLDLIVIGGGINGAGIAADAAGRGLSVGLYEASDFASEIGRAVYATLNTTSFVWFRKRSQSVKLFFAKRLTLPYQCVSVCLIAHSYAQLG